MKVIFLIFAGLLLVSCGKKKVQVNLDDPDRLKVSELNLKVPENWKRVPSEKGFECVLKSQDAIDNYNLNGVFTIKTIPAKPGQTLVAFQDKMQKIMYDKMIKDNATLSSRGIKDKVFTQNDISLGMVDINGHETLKIFSKSLMLVQDKVNYLTKIQHVFKTDKNFYIVSTNYGDEFAKEMSPIAQSFINSIVVTD